MLTLNDKKYLQGLIADLATKKYVEELVSHLPTKEDFTKRMDELMGEVQTKREEQTLHQGQHDDITDRLETVEKKVGIQSV